MDLCSILFKLREKNHKELHKCVTSSDMEDGNTMTVLRLMLHFTENYVCF